MSEVSWLRRVVGGGLLGTLFGAGTYGVLSYADLEVLTPSLEYALSGVVGVGTMVSAAIGDLARDFWAHWRPRISGALIESSERAISRPRRRYLKRMERRVQDLSMKGLKAQTPFAFGLHRIFVELQLDERAPQDISTDIVGVPSHRLSTGSHAIWEFLSEGRNLVILARPGAGKSTLLAHIVLTLCRPGGAVTWPGQHRLPILLYLREHVAAITGSCPPSLEALVASTIPDEHSTIGAKFFSRHLRKGDCLVLLDGLDEVADSNSRQIVSEWVEKQIEVFGESRFVVTSRPTGYRNNTIKGMDVLRACPFNQEQIEDFLERWYVAHEARQRNRKEGDVRVDALKQAEDLYKRLNSNPELMEMASNPMLLTMMALIHTNRGTLPGSKRSIYEEICSHFLGGRDDVKHIKRDLNPDQRRLVLEHLAFEMMKLGTRELSVESCKPLLEPILATVTSKMSVREFLNAMESDSGLLREQAPNIFGFTHKTLQEYLCAHHVSRQPTLDAIKSFIQVDYWRECLLLLAEMRDITPLVRPLLEGSPPPLDSLALAYAIEGRALQLDPALRSRLDELLRDALSSTDPERRRLAIEVRLLNRVREMIILRDGVWVDTRLISEAEYGLFMEDRRKLGEERYPDHWGPSELARTLGDDPILDVREEDAHEFCSWLSTKFEGSGQFRLVHSELDWSAAVTLPLPGLSNQETDNVGFLMQNDVVAGSSRTFKAGKPTGEQLAEWHTADYSVNYNDPGSWFVQACQAVDQTPSTTAAPFLALIKSMSSLNSHTRAQRFFTILLTPSTQTRAESAVYSITLFIFVIAFLLLTVLAKFVPKSVLKSIENRLNPSQTPEDSTSITSLQECLPSHIGSTSTEFEAHRQRSEPESPTTTFSQLADFVPSPFKPIIQDSGMILFGIDLNSFAGCFCGSSLGGLERLPEVEGLQSPVNPALLLRDRAKRFAFMHSRNFDDQSWHLTLKLLSWQARMRIIGEYSNAVGKVLSGFLHDSFRTANSVPKESKDKTPEGTQESDTHRVGVPQDPDESPALYQLLPGYWIKLHQFEQKVIGNIKPAFGILIAKEYPTPKPRQSR